MYADQCSVADTIWRNTLLGHDVQ
uniref:Uncharacterized protein n=1 Tax=Arundo donax TaxID=35708 RepID=A0A0A9APN0_ARUDO